MSQSPTSSGYQDASGELVTEQKAYSKVPIGEMDSNSQNESESQRDMNLCFAGVMQEIKTDLADVNQKLCTSIEQAALLSSGLSQWRWSKSFLWQDCYVF